MTVLALGERDPVQHAVDARGHGHRVEGLHGSDPGKIGRHVTLDRRHHFRRHGGRFVPARSPRWRQAPAALARRDSQVPRPRAPAAAEQAAPTGAQRFRHRHLRAHPRSLGSRHLITRTDSKARNQLSGLQASCLWLLRCQNSLGCPCRAPGRCLRAGTHCAAGCTPLSATSGHREPIPGSLRAFANARSHTARPGACCPSAAGTRARPGVGPRPPSSPADGTARTGC